MKPFITPEISASGQKVLRFQCKNIEAKNISSDMQNLSIVAYSMPIDHSFQAAWIFRLILSNGTSLEFSSACTAVMDWQEVGSLNIQLVNQAANKKSVTDAVLLRIEVTPFRIISLKKLTYEDKNFRTECGIAIYGQNEEEILITTGISPGSVSIAAPFSTDPFEPEFPVAQCYLELLDVSGINQDQDQDQSGSDSNSFKTHYITIKNIATRQ